MKEALSCPDAQKWKAAMDEEMNAVEKNKVWKLTELPEGRKSIPNRWVFKYKTNRRGEIERHRARLVCREFRKQEGIDFKQVGFCHVSSEQNIADICTKNLSKGVFFRLRKLFGVK